MYLLASACAFLGSLEAPSQEECVALLATYMIQNDPDSGGSFSQKDLEGAKLFFKDQLYVYSWNPEHEKLLQKSDQFLNSVSLQQINFITGGHSTHGDPELFFSLPLSHEEEKTIHKIITTLADTNIFGLLFEKSDLERKGRHIEQVHPMRFLGVIFSNHQLQSSMHEIKKSNFKWDGFMEGLERRMKEESHRDNLMRYVTGFAKQVHADPEKIGMFIHHHNWSGLVRYLM